MEVQQIEVELVRVYGRVCRTRADDGRVDHAHGIVRVVRIHHGGEQQRGQQLVARQLAHESDEAIQKVFLDSDVELLHKDREVREVPHARHLLLHAPADLQYRARRLARRLSDHHRQVCRSQLVVYLQVFDNHVHLFLCCMALPLARDVSQVQMHQILRLGIRA